jgi:hypothetical protein
LAIPSEGEQQQRSQRSASIAAVAEQVSSPKPESGIGSILRRASSSLKKVLLLANHSLRYDQLKN